MRRTLVGRPFAGVARKLPKSPAFTVIAVPDRGGSKTVSTESQTEPSANFKRI